MSPTEDPVVSASTPDTQLDKPTSDSSAKGTEVKPQQDAKAQTSDQRPGADKSGDDVRHRGILADLQKERQARQAVEKRLKDFETTAGERDRRLREAVIGEKPEDTEARELRSALHGLSPRLKRIEDLSDDQFEGLLKSIGVAETVEKAELREWTRFGQQMISAVEDGVLEKLGGDKLTPRQIKAIRHYYIGEAGTDPAFLARHEAGDSTLVGEVVQAILEDWYEPARRSVTATEVQRTSRRVPRGQDRSVVTQGKKKIDFKDPKAVEDAMVESYRSHGGEFGD